MFAPSSGSADGKRGRHAFRLKESGLQIEKGNSLKSTRRRVGDRSTIAGQFQIRSADGLRVMDTFS